MKFTVSISYCGDHIKGPQYHGVKLPVHEHERMLSDCLRYVRREVPDAQLVVCSCGAGHYDLTNLAGVLRETWTTWRGCPVNPGYSEGAIRNIHTAIDHAASIGCWYLIHLCEDVVVRKGFLRTMAQEMHSHSLDYMGERWRPNQAGVDELSTQFFGARLSWLLPRWDKSGNEPERKMAMALKGGVIKTIDRVYEHSHTFSEWQTMMARQQ